MLPVVTGVTCYRILVCVPICIFVAVTLMHPAKAVGRNEMPFGRDTLVVPSNILLDSGPGPPTEGEIWASEPTVHSSAACR